MNGILAESIAWLSEGPRLRSCGGEVVCARAPRISLALLDARIGLRKELGGGTRATAKLKWSQVADRVQAMIDDSVQFT
eukprot:2160469-Pyramimonas_sp.AAC.1